MPLTAELRNWQSPVSRFLRENFPNTRPIAMDFRLEVANAPTIHPAISLGRHYYSTIGTAFDWRLRYYLSASQGRNLHPSPTMDPRWSAFLASLDEVVRRTRPVGRRLGRLAEDLLNRHCIVLALTQQLVSAKATAADRARTAVVRQAPLFQPESRQSVAKLLAIAREEWLEDLCTLSWAAYDTVGGLFGESFVLDPTFDGSADVGGADADLILDDCLIEIKTTLNPSWTRLWLDQLLGYVLLDYPDRYRIRSIGIYLARQRILVRWPLDQVITASSGGRPLRLDELRSKLREVLRPEASRREESRPVAITTKRTGSSRRPRKVFVGSASGQPNETATQLELPF
jgi:hypothetical protein